MKTDDQIIDQYKKEKPWGMSTTIDLYQCNPETIRDAERIKKFVVELCDFIDMKRYGETTVVHFGDDPRVCGFSMTQLIETSLISAHFANETNTVYLDVFSCKEYPPEKAIEFAKTFFEAKESKSTVTFRY